MNTATHSDSVFQTVRAVEEELWAARLVRLPEYLRQGQNERLVAIAVTLDNALTLDSTRLPFDVHVSLLRNASALIEHLRRTDIGPRDLLSSLEAGLLRAASQQQARIAPFRTELRSGHLHTEKLAQLLNSMGEPSRGVCAGWYLNEADSFFDALIAAPAVSINDPERRAGMLQYQPTGVHALLEMAENIELGPQDVFCDLGSGFSRIPILMSLVTGARSIGVEFCSSLHQAAGHLIAVNQVKGVEPVHANVLDFDFTRANVFYLFNPFEGALLDGVLEKLVARAEAGRGAPNRVTIASLGICSKVIARTYGGVLVERTDPALDDTGIRLFQAR